MPEADRFEKKLPPHWRRPYRIAKGDGAGFGVIVDCLMPAIRETLTRYAKPEGFFEAFELLFEAVSATTGQQQSLLNWTAHIARLDQSLDALETQREDELCIRLVARAALRAYARLKAEDGPVAAEHVRDVFAEMFSVDLLEHQWFSKVRAGLMEAQERGLDAQREWERTLIATIEPQMHAFFRTLFSTRHIPLRVPPRLTKPMEITHESLSKPIDLQGLPRE
jgi:hypothetical protein